MARKKQDIPEETPHDSQTNLNEMVDSVIQAEVASSDINQETQRLYVSRVITSRQIILIKKRQLIALKSS